MSGESPVEVARALRWRVARDVLLDPFAWVGGVLLAAVLARVGGSVSEASGALVVLAAAPLISLALGIGLADALFFRTQENDLLRTQPLGEFGLLEVRRAELGWWLQAAALLAAAVGLGAAGPTGGIAAYLASRLTVGGSATLALWTRSWAGRSGAALGMLGVSGVGVGLLLLPRVLPLPDVPGWVGAFGPAGLGLALGVSLRSSWGRLYEVLASDAAAAPSTPRSRFPRVLSRLLPLPATWRARVVRDLTLLLRGRDGRGAVLLALSPAAALTLRFDPTPTSGQLLWQVLSAAALGGGAIAYAVGPGVHRLRLQVLPWVRVTPRPGQRALGAALVWGAVWATLHSGLLLLVVANARDGWFLQELPGLVLPVLALELSMVHFSVVFTLSRTTARGLLGEGMLAIALPAVAVGVALAGVLAPWAMLLYPLLTIGMTGEATHRLDQVEVPR
ncbi:MAG: hypothetical protein KDA24_14080 [Deltaproteobacteria bacterium]|nr:hypothetical protein [Deltaproteobacteria bacterium]